MLRSIAGAKNLEQGNHVAVFTPTRSARSISRTTRPQTPEAEAILHNIYPLALGIFSINLIE